jgi:hypothetical protein
MTAAGQCAAAIGGDGHPTIRSGCGGGLDHFLRGKQLNVELRRVNGTYNGDLQLGSTTHLNDDIGVDLLGDG